MKNPERRSHFNNAYLFPQGLCLQKAEGPPELCCTSHLGSSLEGLSLFHCLAFPLPQPWKWEFSSYRSQHTISEV